MENPTSNCRGKCKPGCSDRVRRKKKRACTYRAGANGCGAGAGRGATTSLALCDDEYAAHDDGSAVPNDESAACDDGWECVTTGRQLTTTGTEIFKNLGYNEYATPNDGYRFGRRRVLLG